LWTPSISNIEIANKTLEFIKTLKRRKIVINWDYIKNKLIHHLLIPV